MSMTFQELVNGFLQVSEAKASWPVYKRICEQYFLTWPEHPSFAEIEDWHRSLISSPHHANKSLAFLKAMYTWALRRGHYPGPNPATGVKAHPTFSRERVMTSQEIALLIACLDCLPKKISILLQVLLTTGCRLTEGRSMRWEDVDWQTGAWRQPKTKNGRPHMTYLPTQARTALMTLKGPAPLSSVGSMTTAGRGLGWRRCGGRCVDRSVYRMSDCTISDAP